MIFNDGQAFKDMEGDVRAPNVLDNLIYRREIPVMIARLHQSRAGRPISRSRRRRNWGDRTTNRPTEYNTLDDKYARVIVDELLPVLYKDYNISKDPERHGIGGASSGAIAGVHRRLGAAGPVPQGLSIVGSFTNLRGGHAYPDLVRKSEKKPIRIFLQDGRNDNRGVGRDGDYDETRDWFLPERPADAGADRKGLRRELRLGHRHARPEAGRRHAPGDDALALARPPRLGRSQNTVERSSTSPPRKSKGADPP